MEDGRVEFEKPSVVRKVVKDSVNGINDVKKNLNKVKKISQVASNSVKYLPDGNIEVTSNGPPIIKYVENLYYVMLSNGEDCEDMDGIIPTASGSVTASAVATSTASSSIAKIQSEMNSGKVAILKKVSKKDGSYNLIPLADASTCLKRLNRRINYPFVVMIANGRKTVGDIATLLKKSKVLTVVNDIIKYKDDMQALHNEIWSMITDDKSRKEIANVIFVGDDKSLSDLKCLLKNGNEMRSRSPSPRRVSSPENDAGDIGCGGAGGDDDEDDDDDEDPQPLPRC